MSERKPAEKKGKKNIEQDVPFMLGADVTAERTSRPNGGKQPIYRGQASVDEPADPRLDRSGHGDLGLGLVRQASREALDGRDDVGRPRHDPVNNR